MLHDDRVDCMLQNDSNWPTYLNTESNWKCRFDLLLVYIFYMYMCVFACCNAQV